MAAIMGLSPWASAYDIWLKKTGQVEDVEPNKSMLAGTRFEEGVLQFAQDELGPLTRNQYRSAPEHHLATHIDAVLKETGEPVECKTAGLFGPLSPEWGEPGTDEIPIAYIIQAHVHMICIVEGTCHVPAFLGGRGFVRYLVERDNDLSHHIIVAATEFWTKNVMPRVPPEGQPSLEVVKLLKREPNKVVPIDPGLLVSYQLAKAVQKAAKQGFEERAAALLAALGDAECGDAGDEGMVTYLERQRKGYTVEPTTYRQLTLKKRKELPCQEHPQLQQK